MDAHSSLAYSPPYPQLILLSIKANLENVAELWVPEGAQYCLTVRVCHCHCHCHHAPAQVKNSVGEDVRENVFVCADEEYELTGSRGTAHFTVKWEKDSKKEACTLFVRFSMTITCITTTDLNITPVKNVTRRVTGDDSGSFVPIIAFDCRGLEPVKFHPQVVNRFVYYVAVL